MVPDTVKDIYPHLSLLKSICVCKRKLRNGIIQNGNKNFIKSICECCHNLLKGNIKLPKEDLEKIRKYKAAIRKILKKSSLKTKKKFLIQHGGFLQILIPAAVSAISSIISSFINKE